MSQDGFILRSVLFGMFLGLAIIGAWLYHPHILALFHSEVPEVADQVRLLIPTPAPGKKEPLSTRDVPPSDTETPAPAKQMVQDISRNHPFDKQTLYPFWRFDESRTAEDFMAKIQKKTGVDLTLGQEGYRYVVYIPAASEEEKKEKAELIKREAGVIGLKDGGL